MSGFTKCGKNRSTEAAVKKKNTGKKKNKSRNKTNLVTV